MLVLIIISIFSTKLIVTLYFILIVRVLICFSETCCFVSYFTFLVPKLCLISCIFIFSLLESSYLFKATIFCVFKLIELFLKLLFFNFNIIIIYIVVNIWLFIILVLFLILNVSITNFRYYESAHLILIIYRLLIVTIIVLWIIIIFALVKIVASGL